MKRKLKFLFVAVLVILCGLALKRLLFHSSPRGTVSMAFAGYAKVRPSSDAPGGEVATFVLTNGTPKRIYFRVAAVDYWTTDGWVPSPMGQLPTDWRNLSGEIDAFQSRVLSFPNVTNGAWRIRLSGNERASGLKGFVDRLKDYRDYFDWKTFSVTGERFEGPSFQIVSQELTK